MIRGRVADRRGPVPGALVRWQGQQDPVFTDHDGQFALPLQPGHAARVTSWKDGYLIAGARADSAPLTLTLSPLPTRDCERYAWVDPTPDPVLP